MEKYNFQWFYLQYEVFHLFFHSDYKVTDNLLFTINTELSAASFLFLDETFHMQDNMKKKKQRARKLTKKQHENVKYKANKKLNVSGLSQLLPVFVLS